MKVLFETYHKYEPSKRCWLDGDYFNVVFREYQGLITEPLIIEIFPKGDTFEGPKDLNIAKSWKRGVHGLIRVKIRIKESGSKNIMRHSNLLVIDQDRREALRFEPMLEHVYHDEINEVMKKYVEEFLPGYTFVEIENHPQTYDTTCEDKGMCVAYVIKAALMFAMNVDDHSDEEMTAEESLDDIKRFASAVEALFEL